MHGKDPRVGRNFAMFVSCQDAETQQQVFTALAEDGSVLFPLNDGFGMIEDRFEIRRTIALEAA